MRSLPIKKSAWCGSNRCDNVGLCWWRQCTVSGQCRYISACATSGEGAWLQSRRLWMTRWPPGRWRRGRRMRIYADPQNSNSLQSTSFLNTIAINYSLLVSCLDHVVELVMQRPRIFFDWRRFWCGEIDTQKERWWWPKTETSAEGSWPVYTVLVLSVCISCVCHSYSALWLYLLIFVLWSTSLDEYLLFWYRVTELFTDCCC